MLNYLYAIIMYVASILFGISLSDLFFSNMLQKRIYIIGAGIPIGFIISAYMMLVLSIPFGSFNALSVPITALIELLLSAAILRTRRKEWRWSKFETEFKKNKFVYTSIITIALLLILFQAQGLYSSNGAIWSGSNYATDFMFHIGIGTSVLFSSFPPHYPYIYNATNVFPFIGDFYTQLLSYSGFGIAGSTYAVNFLLWLSLAAMLAFFFAALSKEEKTVPIGIIIFLFFSLALNFIVMSSFNISLPGFTLNTLHSISKQGILPIITTTYYNFEAPFYNNLMIQHDMLFGFPVAILIITFIYLNFIEKPKKRPNASMAFAGGLFGLLPLVNPFCFIFVFIFSATIFVYSILHALIKRKAGKRTLASWLCFGLVAFLVSVPSLLYISSQHRSSDFIHSILYNSVWYSYGYSLLDAISAHISFWFWSIGILLPVGLVGIAILPRRAKIAFIPSLLTFLVLNIYRFQPSFGDNNKLMMFFSLFLALGASVLILKMWRSGKGSQNKLLKLVAFSIFLLIVLGGVASIYYIFAGQGYIISRIELKASAWLINNTSHDAVFQSNCYNYTFDFLSTTAGRNTLLDIYVYSGTDGILPQNYNPFNVMVQMGRFLSSPTPQCSAFGGYNVDYVVLERITGKNTLMECAPANFSAFENSSNFTEVYNMVNQGDGNRIAVFRSNC